MNGKIKIFLVEDEVISAMLMKMELQNIGYEVINHASSGEDALKKVKSNNPDIILMDIRLSGKLDGINTASLIKSEINTQIIFTTCYDDESLRKKASECNPLGYLIKPINMNELQILIDNYFKSI